MSTQPKTFLTEQEYLEIERKAPRKSEYFRGEMFAMSGARAAHNQLVANLIGLLHAQLRGRRCNLYANDMRTRVGDTTLYTYPDVIVVCGEPRFIDAEFDTLLNPTLIVEVLSPSTEAYDRGLKFELYRSIESLAQYLLVSPGHMHTDLYTRQPDGGWLLTSGGRPEDIITLDSIGCRLDLAGVYEKVEIAPAERLSQNTQNDR